MSAPAGPQLVAEEFGVSRETIARLDIYKALLERWQAKTNLVARSTLEAFWHRHVADSLQVLPIAGDAQYWVDLGSGGGFPGLVLAIARMEAGRGRHVLIESNARKCAFLREVARETGAAVDVVNDRIERAGGRLAAADALPEIVTARALAPLSKLLEWSAPLLAEGGRAIFHKGREYAAELEECHGLWEFDLVSHVSRLEADSVLLEIRSPRRCKAG